MPKTILLADDSITIQKVVELTFSDGDYEVIAVNNGAKAIQKLSEMRPDIILSDIIMPEKNGYEVCEFVKSHPDYRSIPVVLLTGTFEPFDPDRAEKAGCDAVVTKPFESQSLIHKVEELISQAASSAASSPPSASPSAWDEPVPPESEGSPFSTSGGTVPLPETGGFTHSADIFGSQPAAGGTTEMPFESPAEPFGAPPGVEEFSGETRAFPRMSFEDMQKMAAGTPPAPEPPPPPAAPPSWSAPPAFTQPEAQPSTQFEPPPPAPSFSAETRAFPPVTFDQIPERAPEPPPPPPSPAAEASPWDDQTEARPFAAPPLAEPAAPQEASPWEEGPAFGGETRTFPRMTFDDLQQMANVAPQASPSEPPPPASAPWEDEKPAAPSWSTPSQSSDLETPGSLDFAAGSPGSFGSAMPEDMPGDKAMGLEAPQAAPEVPSWSPLADEQAFLSSGSAEAEARAPEPSVPSSALAPEPAIPISARSSDLTEEQIDRIARRVVEMMSEQVVRNIAWEVIPDLAEMVVKERIRQLESEA